MVSVASKPSMGKNVGEGEREAAAVSGLGGGRARTPRSGMGAAGCEHGRARHREE